MTVTVVDEARLARARASIAALRRATAEVYAAVADLSDATTCTATGHASTAGLVEELFHVDRSDARAWVSQAEKLTASTALSGERLPARLPATARALVDEEIGREHVAVIERWMKRVEAVDDVHPQDVAGAEERLATAARVLGPRGVEQVAARILAHLDPDGLAPDDGEPPDMALRLRRRRKGGISFDGRFAGVLDAESFTRALEPLAEPAGPDDLRSREERLGEALLECVLDSLGDHGLSTDTLHHGHRQHGHDNQPGHDQPRDDQPDDQLRDAQPGDEGTVDDETPGTDDGTWDDDDDDDDEDEDEDGHECSAETPLLPLDPADVVPALTAPRAAPDTAPARRGHAGSCCPIMPGRRVELVLTIDLQWLRDGVGHATLDDTTPVPAADARTLACDAGIIPIVLGGACAPLDVGRLRRTVPTGMRRALNHRDGGCTWPGCGRRPRRCHAHHVREWLADDGPTALDNLTLLCSFHHGLIHRTDWTIHMIDGRPWYTPPAHLDPDRTPRPGGPTHHATG